MKIYVIAARDRRRCGKRFIKGQNGPFDMDDLSQSEWETIDADQFLTVKASQEDPSKPKSGSSKGGGKKPSAAEKRAMKAAEERTAAIKNAIAALPKDTPPTLEVISKAEGLADLGEDELVAVIADLKSRK